MSKNLYVDWSAHFAMNDERGKSRMNEATIQLLSLISYLNLGSEEMSVENYVQLAVLKGVVELRTRVLLC